MAQNRRINFIFGAQGGQVIATLNRIRSGLITTGDAASRSNRNLGMFNRTLYAIGTTMRYAFAGSVVYGIASTVTALRDYNQVLANIATTAESGGRPLGISQLQGIGDALRDISAETAVPLNDLGDSVRNIYSSLQGITTEDATEFAQLFAQGASVAETSAYDFGNAIISMKNAFNLSNDDMMMIAGQFQRVVMRSIGMTGDEWARQSGRIVAGAQAANISLDEMNTLMVLMTQQGGTAATNVRHLAQLLSRMRTPTQESLPLWAAMGLSPDQMSAGNMGGIDVLNRIREYITQRFGKDAFSVSKFVDDESLAEATTPEQLGISGRAAQFIYELTGRMESARALAILLQQMPGGPNQRTNPGFDAFNAEMRDTADNIKEVNERVQERQNILHMQRAALAIKNYKIEFVKQFEGIIRTIDRGIQKFSAWEDAPLVGAITLGSIGALVLALSGGKAVGKLFKGVGAAGIAAGGLAEGAAPTGTFSNPVWVMVHPFSPGGFGGVPLPGGPGKKIRGWVKRLSANKLGRTILRGAGITALLGGALAFPDDTTGGSDAKIREIYNESMREWLVFLKKRPFEENIKGELWQADPIVRKRYIASLTDAQKAIVRERMANQARRNREFNVGAVAQAYRPRGTTSTAGGGTAATRGGGAIRILLEPTAEAKKLVKGAVVHVPYAHWSGGAYPSSRGGRPNFGAGQRGG